MKNLTPMKAIRKHCIWCCVDQAHEVRMCQSQRTCPLWQYRLGRMPKIENPSPLRAIRARCIDCVGGSVKDVSECHTECALNPYRFGKRVNVSEGCREQARIRAKLNPLFQKRTTERPIQPVVAGG